MYVANHFVRVCGKMFAKGEEITEVLTEDKAEWLLRAGAISVVAPTVAAKADKPEPEPEPKPELPMHEDPEEIPEIDVMAGVVDDKPPAGKKQTGRRKRG